MFFFIQVCQNFCLIITMIDIFTKKTILNHNLIFMGLLNYMYYIYQG